MSNSPVNRILFLQLPRLDNDVSGAHENLKMAEGLLFRSMMRADTAFSHINTPADIDLWDDRYLIDFLLSEQPDIIAVTLYAWNIERTLDVLARARPAIPELKTIAGGPEVAPDNPLLSARTAIDALAMGEGEPLIAPLITALRDKRPAPFANTAVARAGAYAWGTHPPPHAAHWPNAREHSPPLCGPDTNGMAYVEATRGCPFRCSYCCYNQRRTAMAFADVQDITRSIKILRSRGAREVRFVDPTLNSHPQFDDLLAQLGRLNSNGHLTFFGELHPERITQNQAAALMQAGFRELEVGVQSRDPSVLKAVRRPTNQDALDRGIRHLVAAGIKLTVDVMGGLPLQTLADIDRSLEWASTIQGADVQFMNTLLLPGTELRRRWGHALTAQNRPPYRVTRTDWMTSSQLRKANAIANDVCGGSSDTATQRFVACRLPDLFTDQVAIRVSGTNRIPMPAGSNNRRALLFEGTNLFASRHQIADCIQHCVRAEPHMLWQFVLRPTHEEPLDLLDHLIQALRRFSLHTQDNMLAMPNRGQRAARRLFIKLRRGHSYDPSWVDAAEDLLSCAFY